MLASGRRNAIHRTNLFEELKTGPLTRHCARHGLTFADAVLRIAGRYLFEQLGHDAEHFVVSGEAK